MGAGERAGRQQRAAGGTRRRTAAALALPARAALLARTATAAAASGAKRRGERSDGAMRTSSTRASGGAIAVAPQRKRPVQQHRSSVPSGRIHGQVLAIAHVYTQRWRCVVATTDPAASASNRHSPWQCRNSQFARTVVRVALGTTSAHKMVSDDERDEQGALGVEEFGFDAAPKVLSGRRKAAAKKAAAKKKPGSFGEPGRRHATPCSQLCCCLKVLLDQSRLKAMRRCIDAADCAQKAP